VNSLDDPFHLQRFVTAQAPVCALVCAELAAGRKDSHWMWFVFPQLRGLGFSAMAQHYGLASLQEAQAYWQHPLLGARLRQCVQLLLGHTGKTAQHIMGGVDAMKLRSCLTLFARAAPQEPAFDAALRQFFDGQPDERTLALLEG
jgi:uncharacterized protein (DUF1810 family)